MRAAAAFAAVVALVCATVVLPAAPAGAVTGQYWIGRLQLNKVWKITRGAGVTVAVVDTGVPPTRDLGSRLLAGRNLVNGSGNGRVDPGANSGAYGYISHGQNMAEIIAGDGSHGIAGIAPQAKILPVKVVDRTNGTGAETAVDAGIRYAVSHGAQVINVSLGQDQPCDAAAGATMKYAYQHDVIVVASTGDSGVDSVDAPANCPGVLAVAGIASNAAVWSGSNYGSEVDLANFGKDVPTVSFTGEQTTSSGTSPSSAFTAGEIALLRSKYPKASARAIVTRLLYGIDTLSKVKTGTRVNDHVGYGVPIPLAALRDKVPSDAVNPIYDAFAKKLGPGSGNPSSTPSPGSSGTPSSQPTSQGTAPSGATSSGGGTTLSGGGTGVAVYIGAAVLLIAIIGVGIAVSRTRRRLRAKPPYGPGPPPPPPGYAPPR